MCAVVVLKTGHERVEGNKKKKKRKKKSQLRHPEREYPEITQALRAATASSPGAGRPETHFSFQLSSLQGEGWLKAG